MVQDEIQTYGVRYIISQLNSLPTNPSDSCNLGIAFTTAVYKVIRENEREHSEKIATLEHSLSHARAEARQLRDMYGNAQTESNRLRQELAQAVSETMRDHSEAAPYVDDSVAIDPVDAVSGR